MTVPLSSKNRVALAAICLSALMLGLEISSIPSILPTLEAILPADFRQLQWIMNAYTIAMTTFLMAMGALADNFGRKRIFMIGIAVFGVASLACGLADGPRILIAARFLQGASGAAMLACQTAILSDQFRDGPDRGTAFSWWGIVFGLGLGFGPLIGGATAVLIGWQWVFLVHVALALVTLALARRGVVESSDPNAVTIDLAGIVTLSVAVFCAVYLITQGSRPSADDPYGLALAALGAASLIAFIVVETQMARPMFDFNAFRIGAFSGALLGSAGMNCSFWPFVIYLPIYLQARFELSSVTAGLALLAYTLPTLVVPAFAERALIRYGARAVISTGLLTIGVGFILMWLGATADLSGWLTMLPGCIVAGAGLGLTNTPVTNTTTAALRPERAGMASGMDMSTRMIALAINIALMGFILLQGIRASLHALMPRIDEAVLDRVSETVAAGNLADANASGFGRAATHAALTSGFGAVMLYAAICAVTLAVLSFIAFGRGARSADGTNELGDATRRERVACDLN